VRALEIERPLCVPTMIHAAWCPTAETQRLIIQSKINERENPSERRLRRVGLRNYLWARVIVLVVLTFLGLTQVSAQGDFNGSYYTPCQQGPGNWIQCSGNLLQSPGGCMILGFIVSSGYTTATQYYTLHNLPSSYPPVGSWVTVTGQLYNGFNFSPSGAACPGNYINVTTIT
jgi:hypothetical protein